jgi:hypothetical protein
MSGEEMKIKKMRTKQNEKARKNATSKEKRLTQIVFRMIGLQIIMN